MKYYIAIDGGTSNTRIVLMDEFGVIVDLRKEKIGVKQTAIDGNNAMLKHAVSENIKLILSENSLTIKDVIKVVGTGMITSDLGLYELPHLTVPVGKKEIVENAQEKLLNDVCDIPILFMPGIKNNDDPISFENLETMDIMRGEEVETFAVLANFENRSEYIVVLPGSHTKIVSVDRNEKILGCLTTLGGELLEVLTKNTIISSSVSGNFVCSDEYNRDIVIEGYKMAKRVGISRAAFSTRILERFTNVDRNMFSNYLLGVVLQGDVYAMLTSKAIRTSRSATVIVAGKEPIKQALVDILKFENIYTDVLALDDADDRYLSAKGVYSIIH